MTKKSPTKINKVVSLLKARNTGILTLLRAVIPAITFERKVNESIEHFKATSKEYTGTFHILGMPPGLIILKTVVKTTPNIN